jgi:hypothetical protein
MKRRSLMVLVALVFSAVPVVVGQSPVAAAGTCMEDGTNCEVGDVGPRGGIVYYDAGSMQWWGRFLEAKTTSTPAEGIWGAGALLSGVNSVGLKQLGMGWSNSLFMNLDSSSVVRRLAGSAFSDGFYLPSKDELDVLYNYWKISGDKNLKYSAAPMWSSTEASATFAWYQLFQDGTQFTDANGIIRGLKQNKAFLKSPEHTGSNFKPTSFEVIGVRAFPYFGTGRYPIESVTATTSNEKCSNGGAATVCKVGDIGPGGGIVFYDAGKEEYWGRYLEIAPQSCEGVRYPWRPAGNNKTIYKDAEGQTAETWRLLAKGIGMGRFNTRAITNNLGAGKYAAKFAEDLVCNGRDDWFLPSKDELDTAYNRLAQNRVGSKDTPIGGFNKGYYWTSTDYNNATAWSQYFMDGQQFDRVQTMDGNRTPPTPFRVRPVRAFGTSNAVATCAQGGSCNLGDTGPGGGTVVYAGPRMVASDGTTFMYIEFSTKTKNASWICKKYRKVETNVRGILIGDGKANTKKLRELCPTFYESILNVGGSKSDWFIPSMNELVLMLTNTNFVWRDKFGLNALWTSTEENSTYAEYRSPNVPGQLASVEKSNKALFVPIRFFG